MALAEAMPAASSSIGSREVPEPVYFGNGCFWGRQYDFVNAEKEMGRGMGEATAVVGYAGGRQAGPDGKVCYYIADPKSVYEKLGHAEVVQVSVDGDPSTSPKAAQEFRRFADTYFNQFRKTKYGMMRSDPQDAGPGYRNVVGIPGGVNSPFFPILKEANVYGMELREGSGNVWNGNKPSEDDILNVVWVVDSKQLPFYRAEKYHQYHTGMGKMFPWEYLVDMKNAAAKAGKIGPTGCPELPF
ncbi:hypothetical protein DUNSADRAFT_108 [Dunaliella salina]|uniref:peptide-methionine (S)-S-oxide reductase n=1 Tax=Dunaliella salina TaxID=3046 RepID=A0ABQ7H8X9_DUNSA|nr:hypothetical protein DUNSADRAFT_108 [Dunaliella salina]|eukprot:KAF5843306.1 hypothetical protein DUNSADRAFT_108 [Dunaliella salina]